MNVLWLTLGDESTASTRVRAYRMSDALRARGHRSDAVSARGWRGRIRASRVLRARRWDVVVVQKLLPDRLFLRYLHARGRVIVWECDDALHLGYPGSSARSRHKTARAVQRVLHTVDLTTTSNPLLASELTPRSGASVWFPGPAPIVTSTAAPRERIVLWLGSRSTDPNLGLMGQAVEELRSAGWECVAVGGDSTARATGWTVVPWSRAAESEYLRRAAVGVMPQRADLWSDRKAGYKLLEYAARGVIPVASDVPAARMILGSGPLARFLLAGEDEDWTSAIEAAYAGRVLTLPAVRETAERFAVEAAVEQWESAVNLALAK